VEKVEEEYLPDKSVITGEKKSKEKAVNGRGRAGGIPGAPANVAAAVARGTAKQDAGTGDPNVNQMEREDTSTSYEVSKTVRKIVEPFGDVKRISLAVLVDGKYETVKGKKGEELKYIPRSQQDLGNIKSLVLRAAGLDETRGDKIEVLNMPFEVENIPEEKSFLGKAENKELVFGLGKYLFYLLIMLSVFLFLLKPIFKIFQKKDESPLPLQQVKDVYIKTPEKGEPAALTGMEKVQPAVTEALRDKALVGSIIREWVKENP
jgi:flagellar M-ring protein FliF